MSLIRTLAVVSSLAAMLAGCASTPTAPLPTVPQVDLARYTGAWFEAALLPNRFQSQCAADTQARYRQLESGDIEVRNRCRRADGSVEEAIGIAKVVPDSGNARLRVSFFRPFYGDYWVLAFGPEQRWVLVGEPTRRYGWVLSRTPDLPAAELDAALTQAAQLGFDRSAFRLTPQTRLLD